MQKTYLCNVWQVDCHGMMDELNPLQGLLEPRLGKGEIGLHRQSSLPEQVPELHLLLITKDEPSLSRLARARPH